MCSGGWDEAVVLWDLYMLDQPLSVIESAHVGPVLDVAFAQDIHIFVSIGHDGFVRMWDSRSGSDAVTIINCGQRGSSVEFAESTLITGLVDGRMGCYDLRKTVSPVFEFNFNERIRRVKVVERSPSLIGVTTNRDYSLVSLDSVGITIRKRYFCRMILCARFLMKWLRESQEDFMNDLTIVKSSVDRLPMVVFGGMDGKLRCSECSNC